MSSWVMTEKRVAATARDAARAILPLLGTPAPSEHRVRGLIVPTLTCGWTTFDAVYEEALTRLLALPPAIPGVDDPSWDAGLEPPRRPVQDWNDSGATWTPGPPDAEMVGPSGTVGRLVQSDRRRALIVGDGRQVRIRAHCHCAPVERRERGEVPFELVTFRRDGSILEVRAGMTCVLCRALVP
jgi:hypothetical protein